MARKLATFRLPQQSQAKQFIFAVTDNFLRKFLRPRRTRGKATSFASPAVAARDEGHVLNKKTIVHANDGFFVCYCGPTRT